MQSKIFAERRTQRAAKVRRVRGDIGDWGLCRTTGLMSDIPLGVHHLGGNHRCVEVYDPASQRRRTICRCVVRLRPS
jgi:hypothetical protein